jgi:hypothetical protein
MLPGWLPIIRMRSQPPPTGSDSEFAPAASGPAAANQLFERRDIHATTDLRAIFKGF